MTIDALIKSVVEEFGECMHMKMYVQDPSLRALYREIAAKHNTNTQTSFPDAGIDLFAPHAIDCAEGIVTKINFGVKCAAEMVRGNRRSTPSGFLLYPRSSLSKTKLRLANSVGIIDSGYRGNLVGAFDCISHNDTYIVLMHDRLVQLCAPTLCPIVLDILDSENQLGEATLRGEGGFGSTGR